MNRIDLSLGRGAKILNKPQLILCAELTSQSLH